MKNLKDYFSSPKSEEVKAAEDEVVIPPSKPKSTKRKTRLSLSGEKSKKKPCNDEERPQLLESKRPDQVSFFTDKKLNQDKVESPKENIQAKLSFNKNSVLSNGFQSPDSILNEMPETTKLLSSSEDESKKGPEDISFISREGRRKNRYKRRSRLLKKDKVDTTPLSSVEQSTKDYFSGDNIQKPNNNLSVHQTDDTVKNSADNITEADTPSINPRSSLLSYFNKVDKTFETKKEEKKTIKVKALVHEPRSSLPPVTFKHVNKVKKKNKSMDFDLIVSEEDSSYIEPSAPWQMRISLLPRSPEETIVLDDCSNGIDSIADEAELKPSAVSRVSTSSTNVATPNHIVTSDPIIVESDSSCTDVEDNSAIDVESSTKIVPLKSGKSPIVTTPTPNLKTAGGLAAYFGIKSESGVTGSVTSKRKTERNLATQMFLNSSAPACLAKNSHSSHASGNCHDGSIIAAPFPVWNHITQSEHIGEVTSCLPLLPPITSPPTPVSCQGILPLSNAGLNETTLHTQPPPTRKQITTATKLLTCQMKETGLCGKTWIGVLRNMKKICSKGELWADRYRPTTTEDVLIGRSQVDSLSSWLSGFQSIFSSTESSDSSGDEFVNERDKGRNQGRYGGNTALIVGPSGIGKTAAVYAVAKCNGYQVLELNASCNRNGKRILQDFSEATQSHKVETKSPWKSKSKKSKLSNQSNKNSLILIEDSDIILEGKVDDGFISSLLALQSSSKRPLVLIANDSACRHMRRLVPPSSSAFRLPFCQPSTLHMGYYLRGVSLMEGRVLEEDTCSLLAQSSGCDLRKALLDLQFYSAICSSQWSWMRADCGRRSSFSLALTIRDQVVSSLKKARLLCSIDMITGRQGCLGSWSKKSDTHMSDSWQEVVEYGTMCSELNSYLRGTLRGKSTICDNYWEKGDHEAEGNIVLGEAIDKKQRLRRSVTACDYLSSIRQLARVDQHKLHTQTRRNKRYFAYLNHLGVDTSDQRLLDSSCSALTDHFILKEDLSR